MKNEFSFNQNEQEPQKVFVESILEFAQQQVYESIRDSKEDKEIRKFLKTVLNQINNKTNLSALDAVREAAILLKSPYTFYNIPSGSSVERKSLITSLISAGLLDASDPEKVYEIDQFAERIKNNLQKLKVIDGNGNINGKTEEELNIIGGIIQGTPDLTPDEQLEEAKRRFPPFAGMIISAFVTMALGGFVALKTGIFSPNNSAPTLPEPPTEQIQNNKLQNLNRDNNNAPNNTN